MRRAVHPHSEGKCKLRRQTLRPHNAITLSCKSRPPRRARCGTAAAATSKPSERKRCGSRAGVQFGAARGGSAAGPEVQRLLSACEGSLAAFYLHRSHYGYESS